MATKECKVNTSKVALDVTNGERIWIKVDADVAGGAFSIREVPDGQTTGKPVLSFQDAAKPPYETIWPWPSEKPALGRHVFSFAATFFSATKYRLRVTRLGASQELVKDCEYKREKDDDKDSKFDSFKVQVS